KRIPVCKDGPEDSNTCDRDLECAADHRETVGSCSVLSADRLTSGRGDPRRTSFKRRDGAHRERPHITRMRGSNQPYNTSTIRFARMTLIDATRKMLMRSG